MKTIFAILLLLALSPGLGARTLLVGLPPQAEMARALAGESWSVLVALPPGVDHERFSPTPGEVRALYAADLFWASGTGFERLLGPKLRQARPGLVVVTPAAAESSGETEHGHHGHEDAHWWLDPHLALAEGRALVEALIRLDPGNEAAYRERLAAFARRCEELEASLAEMLEPFRGRAIYVYHAAFGRFAAAFGLEQVALQREGREASLRELRDLIERARADRVEVVYVQPQHRPVAAETLARSIGARLVEIDPLAADWEANLRRVAKLFAAELAGRDDPR